MTGSAYTPEFLAAQRQRLLDERARVVAEMEADTGDLLNWSSAESVELDGHPGDEATALAEQEMSLTLLRTSDYVLHEIDDALARLAAGTYGWDEEAGVWIRAERLAALPWARREVEGQRRLEDQVKFGRPGYSHDTDITTL
jgi:RNA polymerase-binding transcription factor DksA